MEEEKPLNLEEMNLQERVLYIMNEIRLSKVGTNSYSNYDYFTPDSINQKVNPLLLKYKVFPLFYTKYESYVEEETETLDNGVPKSSTKTGYRQIAVLKLMDVLKKDEDLVYSMPIEIAEIKGANNMQKIGGTRTYAKRYLYMEALNISDDRLDLDSNEMSAKEKIKKQSKDEKVSTVINQIQLTVETLRKKGITDTDIAKAIKEVYSDNGKPSANYKTCDNVDDAKSILAKLNEMGA